MKKSADEEILRAKSIVSVNRLKLNGQGKVKFVFLYILLSRDHCIICSI